jgi:hypothetical protein
MSEMRSFDPEVHAFPELQRSVAAEPGRTDNNVGFNSMALSWNTQETSAPKAFCTDRYGLSPAARRSVLECLFRLQDLQKGTVLSS